jgi:hypothetical protein
MKCLFRKLDILLVFEVGKEFLGYWLVPICSLLGRPTPPDCSERTTTLFFAEIHFSPEVAGYFCHTHFERCTVDDGGSINSSHNRIPTGHVLCMEHGHCTRSGYVPYGVPWAFSHEQFLSRMSNFFPACAGARRVFL